MIRGTGLLLPFEQSLLQRTEFEVVARRIVNSPVFVEHNWDARPAGRVNQAWVAEEGLMVELKLNRSPPDGMRALAIGRDHVRGVLGVSLCAESVFGRTPITVTIETHH